MRIEVLYPACCDFGVIDDMVRIVCCERFHGRWAAQGLECERRTLTFQMPRLTNMDALRYALDTLGVIGLETLTET